MKKKKNEDYVPGSFPVLYRLAMLGLGCRWAVASTDKENFHYVCKQYILGFASLKGKWIHNVYIIYMIYFP